MDLRKPVILLSLSIFAAAVFFLGCGSDDEPPVIFPSSDEITVHYISPSDAPNISGSVDDDGGIWDAAEGTQLISVDSSDYNPRGSIDLLDVIALCDSTYVYFAVSWKDETRNVRYRQWVWDSVSLNDPNTIYFWRHTYTYKDDNIAFFFDADPNGTALSTSSAEVGPNCTNMCHETDVVMYNETGTTVDGWYWRGGVTNPMGRALDLNFVDSLDSDEHFLGLDDEDSPGYVYNIADDSVNPKYIHKIDTTGTGEDMTFTIYDEEALFDTDSVGYIENETQFINVAIAAQADSVFVPGFVLSSNPSGSRWDVEASGSYNQASKTWTVEFKRRMNTGNSDDIVFELDNEYGVVVAIGNNTKQPHTGFDPVLLKF